MRSPSSLEPEFTAEDWALIEQKEAFLEKHFEQNVTSDHVQVTTDGERLARRHWNEVVRRLRAAGWIVNLRHKSFIVERPPLGDCPMHRRTAASGPGGSSDLASRLMSRHNLDVRHA
jgi:hypothetical protein